MHLLFMFFASSSTITRRYNYNAKSFNNKTACLSLTFRPEAIEPSEKIHGEINLITYQSVIGMRAQRDREWHLRFKISICVREKT